MLKIRQYVRYVMERKNSNELAFSLSEVLVVLGIIAVLAAIAIPVFNGQKRKATEAGMIADAGTIGVVLSEQRASAVGNSSMGMWNPTSLSSAEHASPGNTVSVYTASEVERPRDIQFCVEVTNPASDKKATFLVNSSGGAGRAKIGTDNCAPRNIKVAELAGS